MKNYFCTYTLFVKENRELKLDVKFRKISLQQFTVVNSIISFQSIEIEYL